MSDYISRDELLELYAPDPAIPNFDDLKLTVAVARQNVLDMPATDVVKVRHGRWIEDERTYPGPGLKNNLCSACGEVAGAWKEGLEPGRKWAYCPNCGALMDKEGEHGD